MQLWIARTGEESCQLPCFQRQIADQQSCKQYERTISPRYLMLFQDFSHSQFRPNLSTTWVMAHCRWLSRLSLTTSSERTGCSIVYMHISYRFLCSCRYKWMVTCGKTLTARHFQLMYISEIVPWPSQSHRICWMKLVVPSPSSLSLNRSCLAHLRRYSPCDLALDIAW